MKSSRRQFLIQSSLTTLVGLSTSACSSPETENTIRMGVTQRPRMLDPRKATDALSSRVNRLLYRQLVDFNDAFEPIPDLATWQQLSATHYRFKLQEQVRFHNGAALTAEDVAATYLSVLNEDFGSPHRGSLKHIQAIKVVSDSEVDFVLSKPDALFVGRLLIGILPKELVDKNHAFHLEPVGAGACRFIQANEQKLVLQRISDNVKLVFMPVKDATVRVLKLVKGELDWIQNDLSPELIRYCDQTDDLKVSWFHGTNFGYIGFNFEDSLLALPEMRQAIAYAIDRQAIVDALFQGQARLATGLLTPEHWAGAKDLPQYNFDLEKARKLIGQVKTAQKHPLPLTEEGLIELSFKTSSDPTRIRLATIYQSQLRKVGIDLKVQSYDWGTFYNDIKKGRFQLYSLAWVGVKSPDIFQYVFASDAIPPNGANRGRYISSAADDLIKQALNSDSIEEQAELYQSLQSILHQDLAAMPLWYENQYAVVRKKLVGYQMFADGRFDGILTAKIQE